MIENKFVKVKGVNSPEMVELPLEFDNTLSLAVLCSQFPYSTGLKYRNPKNNQIRTVRRADGQFFLSLDLSWDDFTFFCVCPQSKLKILQNPYEKPLIPRKLETIKSIYRKFPETFDLIAFGMSYDTTEQELDKYLNRFGKLVYCRLKHDEIFGHSRGLAYFRFVEIRAQNLCLSATHVVDKTKIIIKIPNEKISFKENKARKLYVSNVASTLTREDIRAYFSQYGQVINVFMPPDKRCFAFVTFHDGKSIGHVMSAGTTHVFNGARVNVSRVLDKDELAIASSLENREYHNQNHKRTQPNETHLGHKNPKISKPDYTHYSENNCHLQYSEQRISASNTQALRKPLFSPNNFNQPLPLSCHPFSPHSSNVPPTIQDLSQIPQHFSQVLNPLHSISFNHATSPSHSSFSPYTIPNSPSLSTRSVPSSFRHNSPNQPSSYSTPNSSQPQMLPQSVHKEPSQTEARNYRSHDIQFPMHFNLKSFQSLVVKEIITQFHEQRKRKSQSSEQSKRVNWLSLGKPSSRNPAMNCSQLENQISQMLSDIRNKPLNV